MVQLKAFKAYRPKDALAKEVAALPYDVMNEEEAKEMIKKAPYSFLQMDKPEIHKGPKEENVYQTVANKLSDFVKEEIFIQDEKECLYLYGLHDGKRSQYGIVGLVSCEDYDQGLIKKHEQTRVDKEKDRIEHIAHCKAHTGPIFLFYNEMDLITLWIEEYVKEHQPTQSFVAEDGVRHEVFKIADENTQINLQRAFATLDALYIADGHHRAAAACAYARGQNDQAGAHQFFLGVIFPKAHLEMLDYNRVVKDESGLAKKALFDAIKENFFIEAVEDEAYKPTKMHTIGMRYAQKWYALTYKKSELSKAGIEKLDTYILQKEILEPLFGIEDPRTDARIDFVGGIRGIQELNRRTEREGLVAFSLYPTQMEQLIEIADENGLMPPKSTWFEPKLRSGLFLHMF
jgi:uncharacterized protein (DUF1015 family)